jgi:hypothetical protein
MPTPRRRCLLVAALVAGLAGRAAAQAIDRPYALAIGPVSLGGEVSAVLGPADDTVFFNYTDYEHNALRMARLRLAAEWRLRPALSLLGEVRAENLDDIEAAGLYVRWRPWADRGWTVQAGRVPPVIGAFARRAYGRDNPLPGTPLAYQYLTSLRPDALPAVPDDLLRMRGRGWRPSYPIGAATIAPGVPLVQAVRWDTGVQLSWRSARWDAAGAVTRGAPAVPVVAETNGGVQISGRVAAHLPGGLMLGVSGAQGAWIDEQALSHRPGDAGQDFLQRVWGLDVEYGAGRWLWRGEWVAAAFDLPLATAGATMRLAAHSGFAELRYRPAPRWQLAARAGRLGFGRLDGAATGTRWEHPVSRLEASLGFRVSRQLDARVGWQHNWRDDGRGTSRGYPALQLLYWF